MLFVKCNIWFRSVVVLLCILLKLQLVFAQPFIEQTTVVLPSITNSSVAWGDYDNNGYLDILLTGTASSGNISKIYSNNGDNTFSELTTSLTGVANGSAVWGDYDNDSYLDILLTGAISNSVAVTKIYRNSGDSTFIEQTGIILPGLFNGSVAWGDYNNDGYLDILLTGNTLTSTTSISRIYRNNGDNTFTESGISLTGVANGNAVWGDYDNDGYLDIVLTGSGVTEIYRNNGDGTFTAQSIALLGLTDGMVALGDYNNDGYLDILLHGKENEYSLVYRNNGDNTFSALANVSPKKNQNGSVTWGDYDNDGYLDILVTGKESGKDSKVFRNNHNDTFTEVAGNTLAEVEYGSGIWGDYDNDGKLDILLTGSEVTKLYRNNGSVANALVSMPVNLNATIDGTNVTFLWDKATDTETSPNGLSYNLYVYEDGETTYKRAPHAFKQSHMNNGRRLIAQIGNIQYSSAGYTLRNMRLSNYKWSVQAVDAGLQGGYFAEEAFFSSATLNEVGVDVANGQITNTTSGMSYSLNSTNGIDGNWTVCTASNTNINFGIGGFDVWVLINGLVIHGKRKVATIAPQASAPAYSVDYINEVTNQVVTATDEYSVSPETYGFTSGLGAQITVNPGQNLYFRIKATASAVASAIQTLTVTNRPITPAYSINYYNETTNENVSTTDEYSFNSTMADATIGPGEKIEIVPGQNVYFRTKASSSSFKSLIQTLIVPNRPATTLYSIDFSNETTNENVKITDEYSADSSMNSGSILGAGLKVTITPGCNLYFRTKVTASSFRSEMQTLEVPDRPATPIYSVDMVNETTGEDIPSTDEYSVNSDMTDAVSGAGTKISIIPGQHLYFRVKATLISFKSYIQTVIVPQIFSEQAGIPITGVTISSAAWGDYDNDGYLDAIITGLASSGSAISRIYKNNGDNTFTEQAGISMIGVSDGSVAWGDYDNNGYLDILLTGWSGTADVTKIYRNNGDGTFTEQAGITLPGVSMSSVAWGDCDNDGFLDILMTGSSSKYIAKIFHNNGNNTFTELSGVSLKAVYNSSVAWGDYDNDGNLDILLTGDTGSARISKVYRNNGNNTFTEQTDINLTGVSDGSVAWGDYDNDSFLDIILTGAAGTYPTYNLVSKIYHNERGLSFTELTGLTLTGVYNGSVAWGDYNNDGFSDILLTGRTGSVGISKVYVNSGSNTFTEQTRIALPGLYYGCALWGDYDNDDNLDILLTGNSSVGRISKVYRNNMGAVNSVASAPDNLQCTLQNGSEVIFKWAQSVDVETPQKGLSYNLYIYEDVSKIFRRVPNAFTQAQSNSGHRLVAQVVNIQYGEKGYAMRNLPSGYYKWSVQAVDGGLKGGDFAAEVSFQFVNLSKVKVSVVNSRITNTSNTMEYSINSTDGGNGIWFQCTNDATGLNFDKGGFDVWMRQTSYPQNYCKIATIPAQASAPSYTVDYHNETTAEIFAGSDEYSYDPDMTGVLSGTNKKLALIPGQNLYYRIGATDTTVSSDMRLLVVPNRPPVTGYTINYADETTSEPVSVLDEYSINQNMSSSFVGNATKIPVTPGQNLYFRTKSTNTSFASVIQELLVRDRPMLPAYPVVNDALNTFDWVNNPLFNSISDYEFTVDSGKSWSTCFEKPINIGNEDLEIGMLQVRIKASAVNFRSGIVYANDVFTRIHTGVNNWKQNDVKLFPNPASDFVIIDKLTGNAEIAIFSVDGVWIKTIHINNSDRIIVNDLPEGMYILKLLGNAIKGEARFIKQ